MPAQDTSRDIGRLNAFTDGVMLVAMTLLVLNIDLPDTISGLDGRALLNEVASLWPKFLGYVLSFLVIGQYWFGYTARLGGLKSADTRFVWLNIYFLLVIGFIPFSTALITENSGAVSTMLYAATMVAASLMLTVLWLYANSAGLLGEIVPPGKRLAEVSAWLQTAAVFGLSIVIAPFDAALAKYVWLLLAVLGFWGGRRKGAAA